MTEQEIRKYKVEAPKEFPFVIRDIRRTDKYGVYETGLYKYKGMDVLITIDDKKWHLSVSAKFPLGYQQLKDVRYKFMPNDMTVAQIFPRRENFVNLHTTCWHLWEIDFDGDSEGYDSEDE